MIDPLHTPGPSAPSPQDECCGSVFSRRLFIGTSALATLPLAAPVAYATPHRAPGGVPRRKPGSRSGQINQYVLAKGFVAETFDPETGFGTPSGFANGNPWGQYTAYLLGTNTKRQRTWRIENYLPNQDLLGYSYSQGSSMYLFEGSTRALLVDTAQNTTDVPLVAGQADLVTVVKHLLGHENDGATRPHAVDFDVAISHSHGDHTGKNSAVGDRTIFYPAADWPRAAAPANYVPVQEGGGNSPVGNTVGTFDLGSRTIVAINVFGHTAGSTAYLDRANQMIATGDAVGSGFVYMMGGLAPTYPATLAHLLDVLRPYPNVAVLPAHFYQLRMWGRDEPPVNGRLLDLHYIKDQQAAASGILDGTLVNEPGEFLGRQNLWTRFHTAQICWSMSTMYPGGLYVSNPGPDVLRAIRIPGPSPTQPAITNANPALRNIKARFYLIRDNANNSLYLLVGSKRALLIGTGHGTRGTARFVRRLAGGIPVDVLITSDDTGQIGGLAQFHAARIFAPTGIRLRLRRHQRLIRVGAGDVIRLGKDSAHRDIKLEVVPLSGHSASGLTLIDVNNRLLFSGDALGEQYNGGGLMLTDSLANFSAALTEWRSHTDGRYDAVYTAHNYQWFTSPAFVDQVQQAVRIGLTQSDAALVPSIRPSGHRMVVSTGSTDIAASIIPAGE